MTRKLSERIASGRDESVEARAWAQDVALDIDDWANEIDRVLWSETKQFVRAMHEAVRPRVEELAAAGITMGGGGAYEMIYFLTRRQRPEYVLETGVAAGWSTYAILAALQANGRGELHSSDFPYFRIANPERYIGYLVPDPLRGPNWHLHIKGDRANLKTILDGQRQFGVAHYDSDKRRRGRQYFLNTVKEHLTDDAVIVMDDVNDDLFFRDVVAARDPNAKVFAFGGKYLGVTGNT